MGMPTPLACVLKRIHNEIASWFKISIPLTSIEPFEVLSQRIGIPAEEIVKLDTNDNPYGSSPKARAAQAEFLSPICTTALMAAFYVWH
jgi:hypothetical protein